MRPIETFLVLQMLQVAEYHALSLVPAKPLKRPSIKARKNKLLTFLQGMTFPLLLKLICCICLINEGTNFEVL